MTDTPAETAPPAPPLNPEPVPTPRAEYLPNGTIALYHPSGNAGDNYTASDTRKARAWLELRGFDPELVPLADDGARPYTTPAPLAAAELPTYEDRPDTGTVYPIGGQGDAQVIPVGQVAATEQAGVNDAQTPGGEPA